MVLKITHNAGFFSCCSIKLKKIIEYYNNNKKIPNKVDSSEQFKLYKPRSLKEDITYHFLKKNKKYKIKYNKKVNKSDNQFKKYKNVDYKHQTPFIKKYFSPSNNIINIKNYLIKKYNINKEKYCAIYYRGTDKKHETKLGDFETYSNEIDKVLNIDKDIQLLVQTDSTQFLEYIKEKYPYAIYIEENITSSNDIGIHGERGRINNYNDIKYFYATLLIMSKCKYIICSSGNCSIWMMYYRKNAKNVHQYLNGIWY